MIRKYISKEEILDAVHNHRRALFVSNTGSGKTTALNAAIKDLIKQGERITLLTTRTMVTNNYIKEHPDAIISMKDEGGIRRITQSNIILDNSYLDKQPPRGTVIITNYQYYNYEYKRNIFKDSILIIDEVHTIFNHEDEVIKLELNPHILRDRTLLITATPPEGLIKLCSIHNIDIIKHKRTIKVKHRIDFVKESINNETLIKLIDEHIRGYETGTAIIV